MRDIAGDKDSDWGWNHSLTASDDFVAQFRCNTIGIDAIPDDLRSDENNQLGAL